MLLMIDKPHLDSAMWLELVASLPQMENMWVVNVANARPWKREIAITLGNWNKWANLLTNGQIAISTVS